jgi:hypothetical protein
VKLTPQQVLDKLADGTGDYDDGDIPGWLSLDADGTAAWQPDDEPTATQRFMVTVTELEPAGGVR